MPQCIFFLGICGTGMGALAGYCKQRGALVAGCDTHCYPPMSDELRKQGIPVFIDYLPEHWHSWQHTPDCVVVGNVIRSDNPMLAYAQQQGWVMRSMAETIAQWCIADQHSMVVAGTHGKTTTTALMVHLLQQAKLKPSYFVGGVLSDKPSLAVETAGKWFVIEGDEYDTAYFDKRPKLIHYRARTLLITSCEFDHADIFANEQAVIAAFVGAIRQLPPGGCLVLGEQAECLRLWLQAHPACLPPSVQVLHYGLQPAPHRDLTAQAVKSCAIGMHFVPVWRGRPLPPIEVALWGEHNVLNSLGILSVLLHWQQDIAQFVPHFANFSGVQKRLQIRANIGGIVLIEDFAHHPTAVAEVLKAVRQRFATARIWALFEPRSATSRRAVWQQPLVEALSGADIVVCTSHPRLAEIPLPQRFNPVQLVDDLRKRQKTAFFCENTTEMATWLSGKWRQNDVLLFMSNGDFSGLVEQCVNKLACSG